MTKKPHSCTVLTTYSKQVLQFLAQYSFHIFFFLFRAAVMVHGSSQARGQIEAAAAGLYHSHSNARSKLPLQPIPQLMAMLDP